MIDKNESICNEGRKFMFKGVNYAQNSANDH
jgi:hypothetical protein